MWARTRISTVTNNINITPIGCSINWKQGKNLTVKTVKKKQKHKSKGNVRTITKQVINAIISITHEQHCLA